LQGTIDAQRMRQLNGEATLEKIPEPQVASDFLLSQMNIQSNIQEMSLFDRVTMRTEEHLKMVGISLFASILFGVPLGILAFACRRLGHVILAATAVIYTIPSLALLVFMIPVFGIGTWPAIVALFLYGLLPIVRNTCTGLEGIPLGVRQSAIVLGLPGPTRLIRIELPMAAPSILGGIKTAAVINVGTATIGALIGAGGYGQPILTGIRLADNALILQGAVPAAILAMLLQWGFGLAERFLVPRGLRLKSHS
jgi:osmoprotectant transport system permease protein